MPFHVAIGQSHMNHRCHRIFTNNNSDMIRNMIFRESVMDVELINKCALNCGRNSR